MLMEYDVKFPDIGNYDLKKPGEMALYHAHSDFFPFRSVIETTKISIDTMNQFYQQQYSSARMYEDFVTEEWAMTSRMLYNCRVAPLSYDSLVLIMVSLLEEAFNTLCRTYKIMNNFEIDQKDIAGQGLERAILYLEKVVNLKGIKSNSRWEYVKTVRDARNMIVHNGGRVKDKARTFEKFGFYVREEDKKLMFEYKDIIKMYEGIMEFIEMIFKKEPC